MQYQREDVSKTIAITGVLLAAAAVVLGALGAHALENVLPADKIDTFLTGVRYHMWHALALVLLAITAHLGLLRKGRAVFLLFLAGLSCFSGSLYAFTLFWALDLAIPSWLGPVTPLGGLLLILAWLVWAVQLWLGPKADAKA